jgi:hypothetical protein
LFSTNAWLTSQTYNDQTSYLIRLDDNLDTLWTKRYFMNDSRAMFIATGIIEEGNDFVAFGSGSTATSLSVGIMVRLDASGNKTFEKLITDPDKTIAILDHQPTPDGGYLISGFADRDNTSGVEGGLSREGYLLKVDANGNKEWDSVYINPKITDGVLFFWDMVASQDGNYLIMATYTSKSKADKTTDDVDAILFKMTPQGEVIWKKYFGVVGDGHWTTLKNVSEAADGTILLGGNSTIGGGGLKGMFFKLTPLGEVLWERIYRHDTRTGDHYISNIAATDDGGLVGCGSSMSPQDGWLIKLDCNGCLDATCVDDGVACTVYDCADDAPPEALFTVPAPPYQAPPSESYTLNITNESTYSGAYEWYIDNVYQGTFVNPNFDLLSGATYEIKLVAKNMTCSDEYVMNVTVDAVLSTNQQSTIDNRQLSVYPNPTSGRLTVISDEVIELIEITDVTGKVVYNAELRIKNAELDINYVSEGVYYLKVTYQNNTTAYQKLIKR